jgi:hypothetical protein
MKFEGRRTTVASGGTIGVPDAEAEAYRRAELATDEALRVLDSHGRRQRGTRGRGRTYLLPMGGRVDRRQLR